MNNSVFDIDLNEWVNDNTLQKVRKPNMLTWLHGLTAPLAFVLISIQRFRRQKLYQLAITPQACYLQKLLNDRYDYSQRRIVIVDGQDKPPTYIYRAAELKPLYIKRISENAPKYIYTDGESGNLQDDFVIKVPGVIVFDDAEMRSLVKVYKLAGTQFKIQRV